MKPLNQFPKVETISESVEPLSRKCDSNFTQNEHVYTICCRSEVAGDVISGENIRTIKCYAVLNFEAASINSFQENQNRPFA